jgi:acyl-CoA thioester hydrolase
MSSPNSANSATDDASPGRDLVFSETEERVRYAETDGMGIAHHKNYFVWFEAGRTEFCRRRGVTYRGVEEKGFFIVVVEASCQYKKPLRYDDRFIVRTVLHEATAKKIVFSYEILGADDRKVLATGRTVHIVVSRQGRVSPLPPEVLEKLAGPAPAGT